MFSGDGAMKEKLLQKIIELFEGLPDKEDEALEGEGMDGGAAKVLAIEAKPGEEKEELC